MEKLRENNLNVIFISTYQSKLINISIKNIRCHFQYSFILIPKILHIPGYHIRHIYNYLNKYIKLSRISFILFILLDYIVSVI